MLADEGGGVKQRNRTRRRSRSRSLGCLGLGLALCASGPGGGASAFVPTPQSQAQSTGSVLSGMDSRGGSRSGCVRQRAPPQVPPSGSAWSCVGHESPMIGSGVNTGERVEEDNNLCTRVLSLRLTTFNLLAPCYKRIDRTTNAAERKGSSILQSSLFQGLRSSISGGRPRESEFNQLWRRRAIDTVEFVEQEVVPGCDIVCFQEFWFEPAYEALFKQGLGNQFDFYKFQRTGQKADGIAILLRKGEWVAAGERGKSLGSVGNRVVLMLRLKHVGKDAAGMAPEVLLANTHLTFPHSSFDRGVQQQQVSNLIAHVEKFALEANCPEGTPRVIVGDFNSEESDPVCSILRQAGYVTALSSHSLLGARVVTHHTHRGDNVMVDHVWIRVPEPKQKEGSTGNLEQNVIRANITEVALIPRDSNPEIWSHDFVLSDHRPVCVGVDFERHGHVEVLAAATGVAGGSRARDAATSM